MRTAGAHETSRNQNLSLFWGTGHAPQLEPWLARVASLRDPSGDGARDVTLAMSTTLDLDSITMRARGPRPTMLPWLERVLVEEEAPPRAIHELRAYAAYFLPRLVTGSIEVSGSQPALDHGWAFHGEWSLVKARAVAATTEANAKLGQWSRSHSIASCMLVGRSLGRRDPHTELHIRVPSLAVALEAYIMLGIRPPSFGVLAELEMPSRLALSVWLTSFGVSKLGIMAARPGRERLVRLARAAGMEALVSPALVSGAIDGVAEWVELRTFADRCDLQVHHTL